jgi:peroxiredoxin
MPALQSLYNDFGEDVVFLFITGDESDRVNKFMTSRDLDFPVYYYFTQVPSLLSSNKLPTTYLIDENQEIVIEKVGAAKWNSEKVRDLLRTE